MCDVRARERVRERESQTTDNIKRKREKNSEYKNFVAGKKKWDIR